VRSNGSILGPKRTISASSAPGIWAIRDAQRERGAFNWPGSIFGNAPFPVSLPSGSYSVQPTGASQAYDTYVDNSTLGGQWMLAFVVTNANGDLTDWLQGDSRRVGSSGTNYFETISTLNVQYLTGLNKQNSKHPLMDYYSFSQMMIREDHAGTIGYKAYTLSTTKSFRDRFTDGTNPIDSNQTFTNQVSSVIGSSGTLTTFSPNVLDFNYTLQNDGARIATTSVLSEAVGGIASNVDTGLGYAWRGNITRADGGRAYGSDGTTTDHTVWVFVR
jgi:hypothetical protein